MNSFLLNLIHAIGSMLNDQIRSCQVVSRHMILGPRPRKIDLSLLHTAAALLLHKKSNHAQLYNGVQCICSSFSFHSATAVLLKQKPERSMQ